VKSTGYPLHSPVPLHFPSLASPCAITFQLHSDARYTMFRGSVKSTGCPLHSPVPLHFPSLASPCAITFELHSDARYTMFRGSVKSTGCPLHSPFSPSLPLPCVTMCHHISTRLYDLTTNSGFYLTNLADWFCITEIESVHSAVRTDFLYKTDAFIL